MVLVSRKILKKLRKKVKKIKKLYISVDYKITKGE